LNGNNSVGKFHQYQVKRKPPVTIIIGIICDGCIVLASDSQTTYSSSVGAVQRLDTPKISTLEFSNGAALVAQSGDTTMSGRAVEILSDLAKGQAISDYRTVADLAQKATRQLKEELRSQNLDCNMDSLREYIRNNGLDFELMIAHYHDKKPQIFTIDFAVGIAAKKVHNFTAIGCGGAIAAYILSWFNISNCTPMASAVMMAIYTIEEVKKVDPYCGGRPRVAIIPSAGFASTVPEHWNTPAKALNVMLESDPWQYVEAVAIIDKKAKAEWSAKMAHVLLEGAQIANKSDGKK
jgi:20S proteasome alpha/beta subunit